MITALRLTVIGGTFSGVGSRVRFRGSQTSTRTGGHSAVGAGIVDFAELAGILAASDSAFELVDQEEAFQRSLVVAPDSLGGEDVCGHHEGLGYQLGLGVVAG